MHDSILRNASFGDLTLDEASLCGPRAGVRIPRIPAYKPSQRRLAAPPARRSNCGFCRLVNAGPESETTPSQEPSKTDKTIGNGEGWPGW